MLRIDSWGPTAPTLVGGPGGTRHYFRHAGQSGASVARLVKDHSSDYRCLAQVTAWLEEGRDARADGYRVLGWTSAAALRTSLSRRLDALNPVAAFRLLDQPEIEQLDRARNDYLVLEGRPGDPHRWPSALSGGVSALDLEPWIDAGPAEREGVLALDVEVYLRRFAATEFTD